MCQRQSARELLMPSGTTARRIQRKMWWVPEVADGENSWWVKAQKGADAGGDGGLGSGIDLDR